jgi:hypothetical protein
VNAEVFLRLSAGGVQNKESTKNLKNEGNRKEEWLRKWEKHKTTGLLWANKASKEEATKRIDGEAGCGFSFSCAFNPRLPSVCANLFQSLTKHVQAPII